MTRKRLTFAGIFKKACNFLYMLFEKQGTPEKPVSLIPTPMHRILAMWFSAPGFRYQHSHRWEQPKFHMSLWWFRSLLPRYKRNFYRLCPAHNSYFQANWFRRSVRTRSLRAKVISWKR
jgi:hypothetical protein